MPVFKTGKDDQVRLAAIQDYTDSFTREGVEALGLPARAACLEVGAGGGSIARWLASRFPEGDVEAVDVDVSLLENAAGGNLRVTQADARELEREDGSLDLIHARFVLSHLPSRDDLLRRFAAWLRPGGWLVVTEPYQLDPAGSPHPVVRRVFAAYVAYVTGRGMDLEWSRSVPSLLARAGLGSVSCFSRTTHLGGGEADRWEPLIAAVADELERAGVERNELDDFFADLRDPEVIDFPQITITAVGQKPV